MPTTRLSAYTERVVASAARRRPRNAPAIATAPTSGGSSAATRPRNTQSERRNTSGNAMSSAVRRSLATIRSTWRATTGEPPSRTSCRAARACWMRPARASLTPDTMSSTERPSRATRRGSCVGSALAPAAARRAASAAGRAAAACRAISRSRARAAAERAPSGVRAIASSVAPGSLPLARFSRSAAWTLCIVGSSKPPLARWRVTPPPTISPATVNASAPASTRRARRDARAERRASMLRHRVCRTGQARNGGGAPRRGPSASCSTAGGAG